MKLVTEHIAGEAGADDIRRDDDPSMREERSSVDWPARTFLTCGT
jgi:hypothetical protein